MPCRPMSVSLEVDPRPTQKIVFGLDKTCDAHDEATWTLHFELREGRHFATVIKLDVEIDPENHPQAEATAARGLDDNQRAAAKVAASVAPDGARQVGTRRRRRGRTSSRHERWGRRLLQPQR